MFSGRLCGLFFGGILRLFVVFIVILCISGGIVAFFI